jgi:hypothetical protein
LTAILSDAGRITHDVTGIFRRSIKRRIQQLHERIVGMNQARLGVLEREHGACAIRLTRKNRPRLGDRVNLRLARLMGTELGAIIEETSQVPIPILAARGETRSGV